MTNEQGAAQAPETDFPAHSRDELMTTVEVAALLRVPAKTVANWCSLGKIPHLKFVGHVRYRRAEIEAWIAARAVPDAEEPVK